MQHPTHRYTDAASTYVDVTFTITTNEPTNESFISLREPISKEITKKDLSHIPQDKNLYTKENTFETVKDIVEYIQSFK